MTSHPFNPVPASALTQLWPHATRAYPEVVALHDPHAQPPVRLTYRDTWNQIAAFGAGLRSLGVRFGDKVALIADNSWRWLIADQGILAIGAADATRSSQADRAELLYILEHSDSTALVVENSATLHKLQPDLEALPLRLVVLLSDETPPEGAYNLPQVLDLGRDRDLGQPPITRDTLATLIYTSGTSGHPKGVMLSHGNLLYQIEGAQSVLQPQPGDRVLSILPTWHSYERAFEYFIFSVGATQTYTNLRAVKTDLRDCKPHYMVAVPRLWESVYEGIQKQLREQPANQQNLVNFFLSASHRYIYAKRLATGLELNQLDPPLPTRIGAALLALALWPLHRLGDRLVYRNIREATGGHVRFFVSGGGSIAEHLEDFYEVVGLNILGGYGLTETSPITHVRRPHRNLRGGDGQPLPRTETRIVDPDTRQDVPTGQQGLVLIRGPQVMQGYYKNPAATAKAIDPQGWFDTGDLGWVSAWGDLTITGRAKDTIVLTNGENIEPQPIEDACARSPFIDQIVLVGQDRKQLGALIVANLPALAARGLVPQDAQLPDALPLLESDAIRTLFRDELNREIRNRPGYTSNDRIGPIAFVPEPFSFANGTMTQTFKIRRNVVTDRYRDMIDKMFF